VSRGDRQGLVRTSSPTDETRSRGVQWTPRGAEGVAEGEVREDGSDDVGIGNGLDHFHGALAREADADVPFEGPASAL